MDGAFAPKVLKFDRRFASEGCGIALTGDEYLCRCAALSPSRAQGLRYMAFFPQRGLITYSQAKVTA